MTNEPTAFLGVDWASAEHQVCLTGPAGPIQRAFLHDATGLGAMVDWLCAQADHPDQIAVAIETFRHLQHHLLKRPGGDREMVEILALVLRHDEGSVLRAVEMALSAGVPTKTHVLNLLYRLVDGKAPPLPPVDAPTP